MEKEDARTQSREQLHARRKQVIRLQQQGYGVMQAVRLSGLSYPTVRNAIRLFEAGGWDALEPNSEGRKVGTRRSLSAEQERAVQKAICDKRPEQLKLDSYLWGRKAVMQLIEQDYGIRLTVRGVGNYLARWGFTPQKPIKKAYEQRPEAVRKWLDEEYPAIAQGAKAEGAEIHWGDETALVNTDVRGRSYEPAGQTPVAYAVGGTRQKLSMLATVTNQGKTRWMIIDEAFNADRLIEFLEALTKDVGHKVFLVLDNLGAHHSKPVEAWLAGRPDQIEVFYLPSYSPELNPEERLNADLKQAIGAKAPTRTKAKLKNAVTEHMAALDNNPERVKRFFQDKSVKYAA